MKVAINTDFGGFGLSDAAFEKLLDRKGVPFEKSKNDRYGMVNYYQPGHLDENDYYISPYEFYGDRADPDLIAVIEEFGSRADSNYSSLKIVEIPDDVDWFIDEYDGRETIHEKHRTWA